MGKKGPFVIGADGGTESMRVGLFDLEGRLLLSRSRPYRTHFLQSGWAEQEPDDWWKALCEATSELVRDSGVSAEAIKGLGFDSTSCTLLFLDPNMIPLRRALLWMDVRAGREARFIAESGHPALKYNGYGSVSAEWMPCKALWIKTNERETYGRASFVCEYQDYIIYKLTAQTTASVNTASVRWYYDDEEGALPVSFYETIGLGDLAQKLPKKLLYMHDPVGELTHEAAEQLGLKQGTVVAEGGADACAGMVGLNVTEPGRLAFVTGSSNVFLGLSPVPFHRKGIFGTYANAVIPGLHCVEGGQISAGSIVKWYETHFLGKVAQEAKDSGKGIYDFLEENAQNIRLGSEGLIVLDSFQGNRTPLVDPDLRGAIWGLSLRHTPFHVFRAILEGIAYGTEFIFRRFKDAGYEVKEIYACGGPTKSRLWMQIHADVSGVPIQLPEIQDAPLLGSAILASVAAGLYPSIKEAARNMVKIRESVEPNRENHEAYRFYVDKYIETYTRLSDLMHSMTDSLRIF